MLVTEKHASSVSFRLFDKIIFKEFLSVTMPATRHYFEALRLRLGAAGHTGTMRAVRRYRRHRADFLLPGWPIMTGHFSLSGRDVLISSLQAWMISRDSDDRQ